MASEFVISEKIRELANKEGLPDPDTQVKKFLDYHEMTGWKMKNGLKIVDKEAAFRNWLRNRKKWDDVDAVRTKDPKPIRREEDRPKEKRLDPKVGELVSGLVKKFAGAK